MAISPDVTVYAEADDSVDKVLPTNPKEIITVVAEEDDENYYACKEFTPTLTKRITLSAEKDDEDYNYACKDFTPTLTKRLTVSAEEEDDENYYACQEFRKSRIKRMIGSSPDNSSNYRGKFFVEFSQRKIKRENSNYVG